MELSWSIFVTIFSICVAFHVEHGNKMTIYALDISGKSKNRSISFFPTKWQTFSIHKWFFREKKSVIFSITVSSTVEKSFVLKFQMSIQSEVDFSVVLHLKILVGIRLQWKKKHTYLLHSRESINLYTKLSARFERFFKATFDCISLFSLNWVDFFPLLFFCYRCYRIFWYDACRILH